MKNPNAIRPGLQELNEAVRRPEHILNLKHERLMLQPKFDGSFIFITRDRQTGETVFCTKDGNELKLDPEVQGHLKAFFQAFTDRYVFEAEVESAPWTEERKVLLNGNLYSGKPMPFHIRVILHDVLPVEEVSKPRTTARNRYDMMRKIGGVSQKEAQQFTVPVVSHCAKSSICITPCREVTREDAAKLFIDGWEAGKARRRVALGGHDYEGVVLINPESLHQGGRGNKWKVKPFHTVDLKVTQLKSSQGKIRVHEVHGYDTKTGETAKVTGGVNAEIFQEISDSMAKYQDVIIEVEVSSLKGLASANPTFKAIRFDKMNPKDLTPSID
jgi:hypothetical protein